MVNRLLLAVNCLLLAVKPRRRLAPTCSVVDTDQRLMVNQQPLVGCLQLCQGIYSLLCLVCWEHWEAYRSRYHSPLWANRRSGQL